MGRLRQFFKRLFMLPVFGGAAAVFWRSGRLSRVPLRQAHCRGDLPYILARHGLRTASLNFLDRHLSLRRVFYRHILGAKPE